MKRRRESASPAHYALLSTLETNRMPRVSNKIWGAGLSAIVAGLFAVSFMATGAAASSSPVAAAAAGAAEPTELKIGKCLCVLQNALPPELRADPGVRWAAAPLSLSVLARCHAQADAVRLPVKEG
mgnify:CR=1 FL=1|jgi:hypothetical protein